MNKRLDHIGIATHDLQKAKKTYQDLLGIPPCKEEIVEQRGVAVVFFQVGEIKIELLSPLTEDTPLHRFLEKRGEGLHHIAFHVDEMNAATQAVQKKGFKLVNEVPQRGADGKSICFLHPQFTHKVLIEFCASDKSSSDV